MSMERFVIACDNHGDMIDKSAERAFFAFCDDFKPTIRIHAGDAFDLRPFRGAANEAERQESMKADVEAGIDFIKRFDPQVWILGNHDHRLPKIMASDPNGTRREYARLLWDLVHDSVPKVKIVPYGKRVGVYQLGDHKVIHGYHAGIYAARQAAQTYGNVIMGHVHTPGYAISPHIDGADGYTSGCLCRVDMEYNAGHVNTLKQQNGWVYGVKNRSKLQVWLARKTGNSWILPSEIREVA